MYFQARVADRLNLYIKPYRTQVWLAIAGGVLFGGLILFLFGHITFTIFRNSEDGIFRYFKHSLWHAYGSIVNQAGNSLPLAMSLRLPVMFLWLFCLVVLYTYTANLIAFLTIEKKVRPFDTLHQLLAQDEYVFGVLDNTILALLFKTSQAKVYSSIWSRINGYEEDHSHVLSSAHGVHLEEMYNSKYAYICDMTGISMEQGMYGLFLYPYGHTLLFKHCLNVEG